MEDLLKEIIIRQHAQAIVIMLHVADNDTDYFHKLLNGYKGLVDDMVKRGNTKIDFDPLTFFTFN